MSFHWLITFYQPQFLSFALAAWFYFGGFVGWTGFCLICDAKSDRLQTLTFVPTKNNLPSVLRLKADPEPLRPRTLASVFHPAFTKNQPA